MDSSTDICIRSFNKMLITNQALFVLIFAILSTSNCHETTAAPELDCDFFDTVNLTGIDPYTNGTYLYENVLIPSNLTREYDYVIKDVSGEKLPVEKHIRGCVCKVKACVRFCCHHNQLFTDNQCVGETDEVLAYDPYLNVTLNDGSVVLRHVLNEFVVQRNLPMPCKDLTTYPIDNREEGYEWTLFENGTFLRHHDEAVFGKMEYCLQPYDFRTEIRLVPYNCADPPESYSFKMTLICLSLVCFLITIFVYLYLPKLRKMHGKCFVCYLLSLFVGYLMLLLDLSGASITSKSFCATTGYLGYFAIMAAFFWMTVISLDVWNKFGMYNVNWLSPRNPFLVYSLYAWGMALALTIIILAIDMVLEPENAAWISGIVSYGCWVKTYDWSAMLYFYGPMLILIIVNTVLFIMMAFRIMRDKKNFRKANRLDDRQLKLKSDTQKYSFFLNLFIIMGISWSLEILSYLLENWKIAKTILLFADYFHMSEGIIILILFVLKRSIIRACIDRIKNQDQPKPQRYLMSMQSISTTR